MNESINRLRAALEGADYRVGEVEDERSFLAESPERVVWATVFETPQELLATWNQTQVLAIDQTRSLAPEKSWELYLLLGTELAATEEEESELDLVRRDTSYARKVLVPGLAGLDTEVETFIAPLIPLSIIPAKERPNALSMLDAIVEAEGSKAERVVLDAFKANRPLFEDL